VWLLRRYDKPTLGSRWLGMPNSSTDERRAIALARCDEMIDWYERSKWWERGWHRVLQTLTIIIGTATPVVLLWLPGYERVAAVSASFAAVVAGLAGLYHWQENWVRSAAAAEALKSERVRFMTRASEGYSPDEEASLRTFVTRTEAILMSELNDWRALLAPRPTGQAGDGAPGANAAVGGR
jgi:hypothetical protein